MRPGGVVGTPLDQCARLGVGKRSRTSQPVEIDRPTSATVRAPTPLTTARSAPRLAAPCSIEYAMDPPPAPVRRLALIGSRDYPSPDRVRRYVRGLPPGTVVVSGGARGVDSVAEEAARAAGLEVVVLRADWKRLGRGAGLARNHDVVDTAEEVVAWWDGESRGTLHTLRVAVVAGKRVTVFGPDGCELKSGPWASTPAAKTKQAQRQLFDAADDPRSAAQEP